jgi:hypothetical protein
MDHNGPIMTQGQDAQSSLRKALAENQIANAKEIVKDQINRVPPGASAMSVSRGTDGGEGAFGARAIPERSQTVHERICQMIAERRARLYRLEQEIAELEVLLKALPQELHPAARRALLNVLY